MRFLDYVKYAMHGVVAKKTRFLLTVLSILIGISSIVIITTIGASGQMAVNLELDKLGLNGVTIKSKYSNLTLQDRDSVKEYLGDSYFVSSLIKDYASITVDGDVSNALVWGGEAELLDILKTDVLYGRGITNADVRELKNVALINRFTSERLFGTADSVGERMKISLLNNTETYTVAGVVDNESLFYDMMQGDMPDFVYIPSSTMMRLFGLKAVPEMSISSKAEIDLDNVMGDVIQFLETRKGTSKSFYYENLNSYKKGINKIVDIITLIIMLIGAISLIVGGIGVMNTMLMSINERRKEIGIKKALGATNRTIMIQFLIEAAVITFLSCFLGLAFGLLASAVLLDSFGMQFVLNFKALQYSLMISVGMGILFGVYPSIKASRQNPVASLQYE